MFKNIKLIAALTLVAGTGFAAGEAKAPKVVACQNFNEFHDSNGVTMGVCGATKPGGKVRILRSYVVVSVVNPGTDKAERVMTGFM